MNLYAVKTNVNADVVKKNITWYLSGKKHIPISKECSRYYKSYLPEFTSNQGTENFVYQTEHMNNIKM